MQSVSYGHSCRAAFEPAHPGPGALGESARYKSRIGNEDHLVERYSHERVIEKNFPNDPFTIYTLRDTYGTRHSQAGTELPVLVSNVRP